MRKKYIVSIGFLLFIIMVEYFIYQKQHIKHAGRLPRCYPTGEMYPYKDSNGELRYDSVFHTIADFKLTDQNAVIITNDSLKDKIYVANFFFCTCKSICPRMTNYMLLLQKEFEGTSGIQFLSHTVDPENDSIPVLQQYAKQYHIDGSKWHLLTGSRQELYDLSRNSYYLSANSDSPESFVHSEKFVLVDNHRIIRGYYNGINIAEVNKLKNDIKTLLAEIKKNKNGL